MAKITITIEDKDNGKVTVVSNPTFEQMAQMSNSGAEELKSSHGYALLALRAIREESKKQGPIKMLIPRLGRA